MRICVRPANATMLALRLSGSSNSTCTTTNTKHPLGLLARALSYSDRQPTVRRIPGRTLAFCRRCARKPYYALSTALPHRVERHHLYFRSALRYEKLASSRSLGVISPNGKPPTSAFSPTNRSPLADGSLLRRGPPVGTQSQQLSRCVPSLCLLDTLQWGATLH